MKRLIGVLAASGVITLACNGDRPVAGLPQSAVQTQILLTDAPFPYSSVRSVDIQIDRIDASPTGDSLSNGGSQSWVTIAAPHRRYDLLALRNGTTTLLGKTALSAGQYQEIRIVLDTDSSDVLAADGTPIAVNWGWSGIVTVNVLVQNPLQIAGPGATITLDFNVDHSFAPNASGGFNFLPWILATATGS